MIDHQAQQDGDAAVIAVHNRIFFRVFQAGNTLQRQATAQLGISTVQWAILGALARPRASDGMTVTELADHIVVSRQNLDGVLTRLERDGYVVRAPDATDKRNRRVQMTPKGWKFWRDLQKTISEFYKQALAGLNFDDKIAFAHYLNQLQTKLRAVTLR